MLFTQAQQQRLIEALKAAEHRTSGEIRVHVERVCPEADVLLRARQVFANLHMHLTAQRNGILFYVSVEDQKFAVWGDEGIHRVVSDDFWESIANQLRGYFRKGELVDGLEAGIRRAGQQLETYFPRRADDVNELPDELSIG